MSGKAQNIYWDAGIFIAWITDEQRPNNEMLGVKDILGQVAAKKVRIITSVISDTEIFIDSLSKEKRQIISDVMRNPAYCILVNVDANIAKLARELREKSKEEVGFTLKTPDALHLASAIEFNATEIHSFDKNMLRLNNIIGIKIPIIKPPVPPLFQTLVDISVKPETNILPN